MKALKKGSSQRGQALVEYALLLPIFLLLAMGILDLGRVVYFYSAINNAAREGARYGIVNPSDWVGIEARARHQTAMLDQSALSVFTSLPDADTLQVAVQYKFSAVTPVAGLVLGSNSFTLDSRATMLKEIK